MNSSVYDALACSQLVRECAETFHTATGLALRLAPAHSVGKWTTFGRRGNPFCELVNKIPGGCRSCAESQLKLQRRLERKLTPQQIRCPMGLTDLAVPVVIGGEYVATLLGGQAFCQPSER